MIVEPTTEHNHLSGIVIDSAIAVHRTLGPGLLETIYEQCLACELAYRDVAIMRQSALPIVYRNIRMEAGLRIDLVVGGLVVVEIKAVERLLPVHEAQLLTYLKLSNLTLGLLINFNVVRLKDGVRRFVNSA